MVLCVDDGDGGSLHARDTFKQYIIETNGCDGFERKRTSTSGNVQ